MTTQEFRYEFDLLYNNIMSDMAPGLDDYEVSIFLTQAQEELVSQLYAGSANFDGFEANEKVRRNLANLLQRQSVSLSAPAPLFNFWEYSVSLNNDVLAIVSERAKIQSTECCNSERWVNVTPVKYDELNKVLDNPYRCPNSRKALRIDKSTTSLSIITEAVATDYVYEYVKKPSPIILSNLPSPFEINGVSIAQTCALDESLHRPIIRYAVQLAAASWASNNKN